MDFSISAARGEKKYDFIVTTSVAICQIFCNYFSFAGCFQFAVSFCIVNENGLISTLQKRDEFRTGRFALFRYTGRSYEITKQVVNKLSALPCALVA